MKIVLGLLAIVLAGCNGSQDAALNPATATKIPAAVVAPPPPVLHHIISYGQSLSLGDRAVVAFPTNLDVPTDYQDVGVMFVGGTRPDDLSALVPFAESNAAKDMDSWNLDTPGESPLYGALLTIQSTPGTHIGSAAGRGGTGIAGLSKGTAPYQRVIDQVTAGRKLAEGSDTVSIIWMQGESDKGNLNYASQFEQLVMDLDADVRAITHQGPVQFYVCLPYLPEIAGAQKDVAAAMPQVHIVCDTATFAHSDGLHLTDVSSRQAGVLLGDAILQASK